MKHYRLRYEFHFFISNFCVQFILFEIWLDLATSNTQQVMKIRSIIENLGHEVATPEQARQRLALKGIDKVNY